MDKLTIRQQKQVEDYKIKHVAISILNDYLSSVFGFYLSIDLRINSKRMSNQDILVFLWHDLEILSMPMDNINDFLELEEIGFLTGLEFILGKKINNANIPYLNSSWMIPIADDVKITKNSLLRFLDAEDGIFDKFSTKDIFQLSDNSFRFEFFENGVLMHKDYYTPCDILKRKNTMVISYKKHRIVNNRLIIENRERVINNILEKLDLFI